MSKDTPSSPLEEKLHSFINTAAKSKVAVVIPMYGYWTNLDSQQLNEETLKATMDRVFSNVHQLYLIFVADPNRVQKRVGDVLTGIEKGGNFIGVAAKPNDRYGDYLRAGIERALVGTDAQYVVCINPWVLLQYNGIDILIDRLNKEDAKIVSGFDMNRAIEGDEFNDYTFQLPKEFKDIDINFFGMKRYAAEVINFDPNFKTHYLIGRDAWQTISSKGFESIVSQKVPIFTFNVDWHELESIEEFTEDKNVFIKKWHFDTDAQY
jgi:hypothetical protein